MWTLLFSLTLAPALFADSLQIRTLSGRPDMVTGGDVLVEINAAHVDKATLNGQDVTNAFRAGSNAASSMGRVDGLKVGANTLEVKAGSKKARLELQNHPITGPVFSGPQQTPFICQTALSGFDAPLDADCSIKTQVRYYYKSTAPPTPPVKGQVPMPRGFKLYDPSGLRPADMAKTTTSDGAMMDYIVRMEIGTINRAIYQITFLHQPGQPLPDPWTKSAGWNGRLVYTFGGGCHAGYHQGRFPPAITDSLMSKGYAEAASSLNVFGTTCSDVISAETLMMVREHFIKTYGVPVYTIGNGGSGGSMAQYLIAQNYPGLLDGITPGASYTDIASVAPGANDCALLAHAFETSSQPWTEAAKTAVSGFATWKACEGFMKSKYSPGWASAAACDSSIPKDQVYDPVKNPKGVRCSLQDNEVNIFGRDPKTGFARQLNDNVGVQYGLVAFNAGKISAAQFVELNERAGGLDTDGMITARRASANPEAVRRAYLTGRVNTGAGLKAIPILDYKPQYGEYEGNIHNRVRAFSVRARLMRANGNIDNHVMLTAVGNHAEPVPLMDRWLDNIAKDTSKDPMATKVARDKPADLLDACWTESGEKITESATYEGATRCNELYRAFGDPRIAAGAPLANDVLKCALKPVVAKDYQQPLSDDQMTRLRAVFPQGVCDYNRPGIGQEITPKPWLKY